MVPKPIQNLYVKFVWPHKGSLSIWSHNGYLSIWICNPMKHNKTLYPHGGDYETPHQIREKVYKVIYV